MANNKTLMNTAMNSGGLIGIAWIIASLLTWILSVPLDHWINNVLIYGIMIGGLFYFIQQHRDKNLGGYISYGQVVGTGTLIATFGAILYDFYFWIYLSFLNTGAIDEIKEKAYEQYISSGMSEEQAVSMLEQAAPFMSPGMMVIMGFFGTVIVALIITLILGIFLKKENPNPFEAETE